MLVSSYRLKDIKVGMRVLHRTPNILGVITFVNPKETDRYFGEAINIRWDNGKEDYYGYRWFSDTEIIDDWFVISARKRNC